MKNKGRFSLAFAAAFCCAAGLNLATANDTNLLARITFESEVYDPITGELVASAERPPWHPYTYPYSWGYEEPAPGSIRLLDMLYLEPPDMTNTVLQFTFDNSAYEPVPSGGAYGLGFGGPHNWLNKDATALSANKADYILSFDARADGLLPGKTADVEVQTTFVVPDDTLLPADSNIDPDPILHLALNFQPTSDWQHFVLNLGKANYGSGTSRDTMAQYQNLVSEIRWAFNLHMPHESFGFDFDNALYLDNLQLELLDRAAASGVPTTEQVIADYNFDDRVSWYNYTYNWTENTKFNSITANHEAIGYGVGGSNAWVMRFDNTAFATARPAYAGAGSGTGGPFNPAYINTTNLSAYKISFDARVEGLAEDKSSTSGQLEFRLRAPDNTLSPPDALQEDDVFFRVKYDVTLRTNWQSFAFTMDEASFTDAEFAQLVSYYDITSSIQPQFHTSGAASDFGADSNNVVVIDNLRFVRIVQGAPPPSIAQIGGEIVVSWDAPATGTVKLQSAPSVDGPYAEVPNATNPYTLPASNEASRFFRSVWTP